MVKAPSSSDLVKRLQQAAELPSSLLVVEAGRGKKSRYDEPKPPSEIRRRRLIDALTHLGDSPPSPRRSLDLRRSNREDLAQFLDQARNLSLFDSTRTFVLLGVESLAEAQTQSLSEQLQRLPSGVTVFLLADSLEATNPLRRYHKERDLLIELAPLEGEELQKWIAREWRSAGISPVSSDLVGLTIAVADGDLDRAVAMIEHAALYADSNTLSAEEFGALFPAQQELKDFRILELLGSSDSTQATLLLHELLAEDRNEFALLGLLNRAYLSYFLMKVAGIERAKVILKVKERDTWRYDRERKIAERFTTSGAARALRAILKADGLLKNRSLGAEEVLARSLRQLTPAR
jgi:DNA polymerase III delta subunit